MKNEGKTIESTCQPRRPRCLQDPLLREVFMGSRPTRRAPQGRFRAGCRVEESWQHLRVPREEEVLVEIETTTGDPVVTATRPCKVSHRKVEKDGFCVITVVYSCCLFRGSDVIKWEWLMFIVDFQSQTDSRVNPNSLFCLLQERQLPFLLEMLLLSC